MKINNHILLIVWVFGLFLPNQISPIDTNNDKLYKKAKSLENAGLIDDAEKIYNQIFINSPTNQKYYNALKKILVKNNDCIAIMENSYIYSNAKGNTKYSKIIELDAQIICNADWEFLFDQLFKKNINDLLYLKKIISTVMNNNQKEFGITAITKIRNYNEDKSFFANELGYYYMSSGDYDKSVREFLNHLEKFPKHLRMINERIMSFPTDSDSMNKKIIAILDNTNIIESKIILADYYFKVENFEKAISILKNHNLLNQLLLLAINLDQLNRSATANDLFMYLLRNGDEKIAQKAVFEFAKSLENRGLLKKTNLPISNFMDNNSFFSSPFVRINESESILMHQAMTLYDSLSINNGSLDSAFRLSEIQFRALGDLDSAHDLYMGIYKSSKNKDLKLKTINRIVDVLLAKGDMFASTELISKELDSNIWNDDQKLILRMKYNQILFYKSELDFLFDDLTIISKEFSMQESDYNNIIDIMRVLILFKNYPELFQKYTSAQLKIHQNKRTEAIKILDELSIKCEDVMLKNLINYQIANLLIHQNKNEEAIKKLESISREGIYYERAQVLIAEIYDHIITDDLNAKIYYLSILQNFPNSIYYEPIRLRLNKIMESSIQ